MTLIKKIYEAGIRLVRPQFAKQRQSLRDIEEGRLGVILVHMTPCYLNKLYPFQKDGLLEYQKSILDICSLKSIPVAVLEFEHNKTIPILAEAVNSNPKHQYFSGSFSNGFDENLAFGPMLKQDGVENILLMGLYRNACVKSVAKAGLDRGFRVSTAYNLTKDTPVFGSMLIEDRTYKWFRQNTACFDDSKVLLERLYQVSNKKDLKGGGE